MRKMSVILQIYSYAFYDIIMNQQLVAIIEKCSSIYLMISQDYIL